MPGDPGDPHSRYIEAEIDDLIVGGIYLPNGNPAPGPKDDYKLSWLKRFEAHALDLLSEERPVILAGDYYIILTDLDVYVPDRRCPLELSPVRRVRAPWKPPRPDRSGHRQGQRGAAMLARRSSSCLASSVSVSPAGGPSRASRRSTSAWRSSSAPISAALMTGKAPFVGGLAATLVVVFLHRLIVMATLHRSVLTRLFKGSPITLVEDGVVDQKAMDRHAISQADLAEGLRMEQVETIDEVRLATLEAGGKISVVRRRGAKA